MTNKITVATLLVNVSRRFTENNPFSTAAAGLQGFEFLGMIGDWFISLEMNRHKVIFLTATNRRLGTQLDKLMVATRPQPGQYYFNLDRADFDTWVKELVPIQQKSTVWELFIQVVEQQQINVAPGKKQELWRSGKKSVSIMRETDREQLRLVCGKTTSLTLARWGRDHTSRNGDCKGVWMINANARIKYEAFVKEVNG